MSISLGFSATRGPRCGANADAVERSPCSGVRGVPADNSEDTATVRDPGKRAGDRTLLHECVGAVSGETALPTPGGEALPNAARQRPSPRWVACLSRL